MDKQKQPAHHESADTARFQTTHEGILIMSNTIQVIPIPNLLISFLPVMVVIAILFAWRMDYRNAIHALARMLIQLLVIGYFLTYLFRSDSGLIILAVLIIMLIASSLIALRTARENKRTLFPKMLLAIFIGCGATLALVTQGVLELDPWYRPQLMIPLAGMIFANSLNGISLAVERLTAEMERGINYNEARRIAFRTSLIPIINSLFAVGLVSLPGMMTGQILSGISPLIAVRYQIMVMTMVFGSTGITSAIFLVLLKPKLPIYNTVY